MTALKWITTEANRLRREFPKRFATWREYVGQASAIYAKKHHGKSPVGKKHHKGKKISAFEVVEQHDSVRKKPNRIFKVSRTRGGKFKKYRRIRGVSTVSRSHTDKNRITANIQVGKLSTVSGVMKEMLKEKLAKLLLRRDMADTILQRRKLTGEINKVRNHLKTFYQ